MSIIARGNGFTIKSSVGSSVVESTVASGGQGSGRTITFTFEQMPVQYRTVYVEVAPITGQTGDFWDNFWSNRVSGEPADQFALSSFVGVQPNGQFSVTLNADNVQEGDEAFEVRVFESNMDAAWGYAPLLSGRFTILDDDIVGTAGSDRLNGRSHAEILFGGAGSDYLNGAGGADTLNGGTGADTLAGGAGDDVFIVENLGDRVIENAGGGIDAVRSSITHQLAANVENLTLTGAGSINGTGNTLANRITGNAGNNALNGAAGNDTLSGGLGNDILNGGAGADRIIGGQGADRMTGSLGADVFVFQTPGDSTSALTGRDTITDFSFAQGDRIDLSALDARTNLAGNQAFSFIGSGAFTGTTGELSARSVAGGTLIVADINGDRAADLAILLDDPLTLNANSFLL